MTLQVAVGAVVAHDLERVDRRLEGPPGALAAVGAVARPGGQGPGARARVELGRPCAGLGQAAPARGPEGVGQDPRLAVGVEIDEPDARAGPLRGGLGQDARRDLGRRPLRRPQVAPVGDPAVLAVHPGEEGRDHLAQLGEHAGGALAGLGERMGGHPHQHGLVCLARGEDPDVGRRGRREQPPQQVERPRPDRALAGRRRGRRVIGHLGPDVGDHAGQQVGVRGEGAVQRPDVRRPELRVRHDRRRGGDSGRRRRGGR